ncbi:hypothetical protein PHSY_006694 [Pseudozyma hubeiensis SY62]|uniref:UDENN domain-containing protein n=1 Tax=Pseudozyma hubeiensis (strain SY62) TaxID=1305764 RepID=R9PCJ9_PSEHS|nr:hypothetical protein PHSY_006694 [Pseudozyma hubeiensis SY62]GAC99096.1 hypothetical protein PHSY_006694 [Pseudozyma hubeiensis SY62]
MSIADMAGDVAGPSAAAATTSSQGYCTFCVLAEFDIDRGSTLSHQYPAPTGYDEHMLAELMLPDGVHARTEDWTFFFLKPPGTKRVALHTDNSDLSQTHYATDSTSWLSNDLTYVINLVRTKHDNTVRRGALVKAMAIGTRFPFIDIFKPALLLALDDYFKEPGPECLARLYDSINRLDLSTAPSFTRAEKLVLRGSDRRDLFEERFVAAQRSEVDTTPISSTPTGEIETSRSSPTDGASIETSRRRTDSTSTFSSETKSLKKKLSTASLRPALGARRGSSANSIVGVAAGASDRKSISNPAMLPSGSARPRDTHYFDTLLTYRNVALPIRVPLTTFPEEVGEYSLIRLIQTFSGPQSTPTGPIHPHLHTNGPSTHPIIVLFNALITQKRVIFLGYGQPANHVASFVLAACALASGCGVVLQGFAARAFPYTNLLNLDDLEKVPGYIAGVTNPRFEDLHAWDLLLNVETGRIQVAKDVAPAVPPASAPSQALLRSSTMPRDGAGLSASNTFGSVSSASGQDIRATVDTELAQFGALPSSSNGAVSNAPLPNKASSLGGPTSRDRNNASQFDSRFDPSNALFLEELQSAIASHYGERFVRARVQEYVFLFVQRVARHEEHFYGRTSLAPTCQPFLNGQLGSGPVYVDREAEMREILSNQMRIEGFRSTIAYDLLVIELQKYGGYTQAIRSFDLGHQIGRLRRAKKLLAGESDLIFETIAKSVVTHDQIVEVLALLPPHTGGLLPLALGLFHPSAAARDAVMDFLLRLCRHPVGRKFVQSMHTYHRLAFARLAQERAEIEAAGAVAASTSEEIQELSMRTSSQSTLPSAPLLSSQTTDTDSVAGVVTSPVDEPSTIKRATASDEEQSIAANTSKASMDETSYVSSMRGMNHPFQSFSPVKDNPNVSQA